MGQKKKINFVDQYYLPKSVYFGFEIRLIFAVGCKQSEVFDVILTVHRR